MTRTPEGLKGKLQNTGRAAAFIIFAASGASCNSATTANYSFSSAATPTPMSTKAPEAQATSTPLPTVVSIPAGNHLNQGDCVTANAGDEVMGDPNINGSEFHDRIQQSGQITVFENSAQVCMVVGQGTIRRGVMQLPNAHAILQMDEQAMKTPGSGNCGLSEGCHTVDIKDWPSGQIIIP